MALKKDTSRRKVMTAINGAKAQVKVSSRHNLDRLPLSKVSISKDLIRPVKVSIQINHHKIQIYKVLIKIPKVFPSKVLIHPVKVIIQAKVQIFKVSIHLIKVSIQINPLKVQIYKVSIKILKVSKDSISKEEAADLLNSSKEVLDHRVKDFPSLVKIPKARLDKINKVRLVKVNLDKIPRD